MQNPFKNLGKVIEPPPPDYVDVSESDMMCQTCYQYIQNGKYYPAEQMLRWECDLGHKSEIRTRI